VRRRLLLTVLSSGAVTAVAGCTGSDGGDEPTDSNGDSGDDTPGDDGSDGDGGDGQANFSDADTLLSFAETGDRDPPYFDADYQEITGQSSRITEEISVDRRMVAVAAEHEGRGSFRVEAGSAKLFESADEFEGATARAGASDSLTLDVDAGGEWTVIVANPQSSPEETRRPPVSASGSGRQLVGPVAVDESTTATASHSGSSVFTALMYDEAAESYRGRSILYNDPGDFDGKQSELNEELSGWVVVSTEGEWTLEFE